MNLDDYEALPDGLAPSVIWEHTRAVLIESEHEGLDLSMRKLRELSHRQWHTYELPPSDLRQNLQIWLQGHWQHSYDFVESTLVIAYSFALNKRIYAKALREFPSADRNDEVDLEKSIGENMDPWWSLGPTGN